MSLIYSNQFSLLIYSAAENTRNGEKCAIKKVKKKKNLSTFTVKITPFSLSCRCVNCLKDRF